MKIRKLFITATLLLLLTNSLNLFDFNDKEIALTNEQQSNIDTFIEAQKYINKDCEVIDIDNKSAYISSINNYGSKIIYNFDYSKNLVNSITKNHNKSNNRIKYLNRFDDIDCSYSYDEESRLTSITLPYATYKLDYDENGLLVNQRADDISLISKKYLNEKTTDINYNNNSSFKYIYDESNHKISSMKDDELSYSYQYDNDFLIKKIDRQTNTQYTYDYSEENKVKSMISSDGFKVEYEYSNDSKNNDIKKRYYDFKGLSMNVESCENGISSNLYSTSYEKDISERILKRELTLNNGYSYSETYSYVKPEPKFEDLTEENYEKAIENKTDDTKVSIFDNGIHSYNYHYDNENNIISIEEDGNITLSAVYNQYNEPIKVYNKNSTYSYEYDYRGNIIDNNGLKLEYKINNGLDELISINGVPCKYDEIGNPLSYKENNLLWQGKNLIKFNDYSYTYNDSGVRTSKIVNGRQTKYYLEGNKVIYEITDNQNPIAYQYENNNVIGFIYEGNQYLYAKNIQNDVTDIIDKDGNIVVIYIYDPWGKVLNIIGPLASTLGKINPYLYRSYRYDFETGFYYLLTRYYDPTIGRFINADDISNLQYTILSESSSKNLYAYADNNPINKIDPHGNMAHLILNALKILYSDLRLIDDKYIGGITLSANGSGIFKGFHETAQLVAAKELANEGYITYLEYPIGKKHADILAFKGINYLYEVKPALYPHDTAYKQLQGYLASTGFISGPNIAEQTIDFLNKIKMKVYSDGNGIIKYSFYKEKRQWFNKSVLVEVKEEQVQKKLQIALWIGIAVAATIIFATLAEDALTAGAGVADDAASLHIAGSSFRAVTSFAMALV